MSVSEGGGAGPGSGSSVGGGASKPVAIPRTNSLRTSFTSSSGGHTASSPPPPLQFFRWTREEDMVLLRHVKNHGTRQWVLLRTNGELPNRDNKACCNRFILLKRRFLEQQGSTSEGQMDDGAEVPSGSSAAVNGTSVVQQQLQPMHGATVQVGNSDLHSVSHRNYSPHVRRLPTQLVSSRSFGPLPPGQSGVLPSSTSMPNNLDSSCVPIVGGAAATDGISPLSPQIPQQTSETDLGMWMQHQQQKTQLQPQQLLQDQRWQMLQQQQLIQQRQHEQQMQREQQQQKQQQQQQQQKQQQQQQHQLPQLLEQLRERRQAQALLHHQTMGPPQDVMSTQQQLLHQKQQQHLLQQLAALQRIDEAQMWSTLPGEISTKEVERLAADLAAEAEAAAPETIHRKRKGGPGSEQAPFDPGAVKCSPLTALSGGISSSSSTMSLTERSRSMGVEQMQATMMMMMMTGASSMGSAAGAAAGAALTAHDPSHDVNLARRMSSRTAGPASRPGMSLAEGLTRGDDFSGWAAASALRWPALPGQGATGSQTSLDLDLRTNPAGELARIHGTRLPSVLDGAGEAQGLAAATLAQGLSGKKAAAVLHQRQLLMQQQLLQRQVKEVSDIGHATHGGASASAAAEWNEMMTLMVRGKAGVNVSGSAMVGLHGGWQQGSAEVREHTPFSAAGGIEAVDEGLLAAAVQKLQSSQSETASAAAAAVTATTSAAERLGSFSDAANRESYELAPFLVPISQLEGSHRLFSGSDGFSPGSVIGGGGDGGGGIHSIYSGGILSGAGGGSSGMSSESLAGMASPALAAAANKGRQAAGAGPSQAQTGARQLGPGAAAAAMAAKRAKLLRASPQEIAAVILDEMEKEDKAGAKPTSSLTPFVSPFLPLAATWSTSSSSTIGPSMIASWHRGVGVMTSTLGPRTLSEGAQARLQRSAADNQQQQTNSSFK